MRRSTEEKRLAPLDALRGLAALGVAIFYHYVHFGGAPATYPLARLDPFQWLYANGWLLVDLFFVLSGVIFTHRYLDPVGDGRVGGRAFFILRFSRIYPLHLFALVGCAAVEWSQLWQHQTPVIYEQADLYNFFLQAVYLQTLFGAGWAYNAPTWSVGAEILAYLTFFLFASRYRKHYLGLSVAAVVVGIGIQSGVSVPFLNAPLARGLVGFYIGSLGYLGLRAVERLGYRATFGGACLALFGLVVFLAERFGYAAWIGASPLANCLAVFPPLVLASLSVAPLARVLSLPPFVFLGEISYGIYLVHVPVQMIVLAVARAQRLVIPTSSPLWLAGYAASVVTVATLVRYLIEKPAMRWMRRRFLSPAVGPAAVALPAAARASGGSEAGPMAASQ
jgi:peptidoglycan/LPS O-acetylase OafA/YrhL